MADLLFIGGTCFAAFDFVSDLGRARVVFFRIVAIDQALVCAASEPEPPPDVPGEGILSEPKQEERRADGYCVPRRRPDLHLVATLLSLASPASGLQVGCSIGKLGSSALPSVA